jgi:hypothetical protein
MNELRTSKVTIALLFGALLLTCAFTVSAGTGDRLVKTISQFSGTVAQALIPAMNKLDNDTSDLAPGEDLAALRGAFMTDPRGYLLDQGVEMPPEYSLLALDLDVLKDRPDAFHNSPVEDGLFSLPFSIAWISDAAVISLQFAAPAGDYASAEGANGAVGYATIPPEVMPIQQYLQLVVNSEEATLDGLLGILIEITTNEELRQEAVDIGLRQYAANRGIVLRAATYSVQITDLAALRDPDNPSLGDGFVYSKGVASGTLPDGFGLVHIYEDQPGYALFIIPPID